MNNDIQTAAVIAGGLIVGIVGIQYLMKNNVIKTNATQFVPSQALTDNFYGQDYSVYVHTLPYGLNSRPVNTDFYFSRFAPFNGEQAC